MENCFWGIIPIVKGVVVKLAPFCFNWKWGGIPDIFARQKFWNDEEGEVKILE